MTTDVEKKSARGAQLAPTRVLVVAFAVTMLLVLGIGSVLLTQRTGTASRAAAWEAAAGSEARIAALVEEQGCEQALVHLRRRAAGVEAAPMDLNAFGVCLARAGDYADARRAFDLAVRRGAGERSPAHANEQAIERFLIARQYVEALDLAPPPAPPVLLLRTPAAGD